MSSNPEHSTLECSSPLSSFLTLTDHAVDPNQGRSTPKFLRIHPVDTTATLRSIDSDQIVFGRDEDCDVVVSEDSASRRHARIIRKGKNWFVVDLGSTNGTWINEQRVEIQQLNSGDRIRVGRWTFKFFNDDELEADYHESVYQMMTRDSLTGAWNKRYLMDVLEREICRHFRTKQPLGLLMIDFDHFKEINDCHGHIVGDEVLSEFGKRVLTVKRTSEVFARFGGDEFAIVLVNSDHEAAKLASERLVREVVSEPFLTSAGSFDCLISCGYAVCKPGEVTSADGLLEAADQKLYQAKNSGRNTTVG